MHVVQCSHLNLVSNGSPTPHPLTLYLSSSSHHPQAGANIKEAKAVPGILSVEVLDGSASDSSTFHVVGQDQKAVDEALKILDWCQEDVPCES